MDCLNEAGLAVGGGGAAQSRGGENLSHGSGGKEQHSIRDFRNERGRSRAVRADLIWRGGAKEGRT